MFLKTLPALWLCECGLLWVCLGAQQQFILSPSIDGTLGSLLCVCLRNLQMKEHSAGVFFGLVPMTILSTDAGYNVSPSAKDVVGNLDIYLFIYVFIYLFYKHMTCP